MMKVAAVFLDRDGTINEDVGYLSSLDTLLVFPEAYEAVKLINQSGMKAVVITNQAGVAKGYFSEDFVATVHQRLQEMMAAKGSRIDGFYYCPHHPTEGMGLYLQACTCRKPEPGMLIRAAEDQNIDLGHSYMVGDHMKDVEAARRVGAKGVLVRTGHGKQVLATEGTPDYIAVNILDAVHWIIRDRGI